MVRALPALVVLTAAVGVVDSLRCKSSLTFREYHRNVVEPATVVDCAGSAKFCTVGNGSLTVNPDDADRRSKKFIQFESCDSDLPSIAGGLNNLLDGFPDLNCMK
ncbi:hypothetical protein AAVH_35402, partial [Aphelenchoides avenae]